MTTSGGERDPFSPGSFVSDTGKDLIDRDTINSSGIRLRLLPLLRLLFFLFPVYGEGQKSAFENPVNTFGINLLISRLKSCRYCSDTYEV